MFEGLTKYSLNRIASLLHFYTEENKCINESSQKGMRDNHEGAFIDLYLTLLTSGNEKLKNSSSFKKMETEVKELIEVIEITDNGDSSNVVFRFLDDEIANRINNIKQSRKNFDQFAEMPIIHSSSTLMMLVTRFEEFISNYLSELYTAFPHKYLDNQSIKFSEIKSANIDEIKKGIVAREVDAKMRASFTDWFNLFASHGIKCELLKDDINTLREIYARRNIMVHNSGIVNESYLTLVPETTSKIGDKLLADDKYILDAFNTIKKIIVLLLLESSKLNKNDSVYIDELFENLFEMLQQKEYDICEPAFLMLSQNEFVTTNIKLMSKVNRWICIIATKGLEEIKGEIESFDVSALNSSFMMAKNILLEKYSIAVVILEELLDTKQVDASEIEEWPLFFKFRESNEYNQLRNNHPDLFNLEKAEVSLQEISDTSSDETLLDMEKKETVMV